MNLERDGVELWRNVLPLSLLGEVAKEYEASKPESSEVPFLKQINDLEAGALIDDPAFPVL